MICGDRNWTDRKSIWYVINGLVATAGGVGSLTIIEGGARGADTLAASVATDLGVKVEEFPAQWQKHGKRAGPLRNIRMLQEGEPEMVFAFHDDLASSKGTLHMCKIAHAAGLDVFVVSNYSAP